MALISDLLELVKYEAIKKGPTSVFVKRTKLLKIPKQIFVSVYFYLNDDHCVLY